MKYYFQLQITRLKRRLKDFGIHPTLGIGLGFLLFFLLSSLLFNRISFAHWIYIIAASSVLLSLAEKSRNDLLKNKFSRSDYRKIRLIENTIISVPFLVYLIYEAEWLASLCLVMMAIFFGFYSSNIGRGRSIPTPFKKFPFEFIVGFRKTFWLTAISYFLIFKSIQVDNYNLGLFGMAVLFLSSLIFYNKPESKYFVWIYTYRTNGFLKKKIFNSFICITILSLVAFIGLIISFPENWIITTTAYFTAYILLATMIMAKYSNFPEEMNILEGILFSISIIFPPLLLITFWIFYSKSKKSLKPILDD